MSNEASITLIVQEGIKGVSPGEHRLEQFPFTIGRGSDCDLVLPLITVSRVHAQIERYHSGYLLRDLESPNGTFLNASRVLADEPQRLKDGDYIGLGAPERMLKYSDQYETEEVIQLRFSDNGQYAYWGGELLPLEPRHVRLLRLLWGRRGKACGDAECEQIVWGEERTRDEKQADPNLAGIVSRLNKELTKRHNIERTPIERVRGFGYKLII